MGNDMIDFRGEALYRAETGVACTRAVLNIAAISGVFVVEAKTL